MEEEQGAGPCLNEAGESEFSELSALHGVPLMPVPPAHAPNSPVSTDMTIFFQTRYCRESRYLQTLISMPGCTGSGSMVQKRLGKEN